MPQLFELSLVTFLWFVPSLDMLVGRFFYFLQICYYHFPSTALLLLLLLLHGNQKNKNWHVPRNQRTTCRESIGEPSDEAKTDGSKRQRVFFNHHRQSEIAGCEKSWGDFFFFQCMVTYFTETRIQQLLWIPTVTISEALWANRNKSKCGKWRHRWLAAFINSKWSHPGYITLEEHINRHISDFKLLAERIP